MRNGQFRSASLHFLVLLAALLPAVSGEITAEAVFTAVGGVQGSLKFSQANESAPVVVTSNLYNLPSNNWLAVLIRRNPSGPCLPYAEFFFTPNIRNTTYACSPAFPQACAAGDIGGRWGPLPNGPNTFEDNSLHLYGVQSIVGHGISFALDNNNRGHSPTSFPSPSIACSNVELTSASRMRVAVARFPTNSIVLGSVVAMQPYDDPHAQVTLFNTIYYNSELPEYVDTGGTARLTVHVKPVGTDADAHTPAQKRCLSAGGLFKPLEDILSGTKDAKEIARLCRLANLDHDKCSRELSNITESTRIDVNLPGGDIITDPFSSLQGNHSLVNRSVSIDANDIAGNGFTLGCATFEEVSVPSVIIPVYSNGRYGSVILEQWDSSFPTRVTVNVQGPAGGGVSLRFAAQPTTGESCVNILDYDPTMVNVTDYDMSCTPTSPMRFSTCALGDLSGRWGAFLPDTTVVDFLLPIHGTWSVAGRALVVETIPSEPPSCSTVPTPNYSDGLFSTSSNVRVATAHFATNVAQGTFTFEQPDAPYVEQASTVLTINMWTPTRVAIGDWYISTGDCSSTYALFNPSRVLVPPTQCTPFLQNSYLQVCPLGSLGSKGGPIVLPATSYVVTLEQVALDGVNSIVGRSLFLTDAFGQHFSCAAITSGPFPAATTSVTSTATDTHIVLSQATRTSPVTITFTPLSFTSTRASSGNVASWFISSEPLTSSESCSAIATARKMFNPYPENVDVAQCSPTSPLRFSACAVGDLAGKYGAFPANPIASVSFEDPTLTLFGAAAVQQRTLVLTDSTGAAIECATLAPGPQSNVTTYVAAAQDVTLTLRQDTTQLGTPTILEWTVSPDLPSGTSSQWALQSTCSLPLTPFNPFGVTPATVCQAQSDALGTCASGDLTHLAGALATSPASTKSTAWLSTTEAIFLDGRASVDGQMLVMDVNGAPVCAPLVLQQNPSPTPTNNKSGSSLSTGVIVGLAVGAIVIVVLVAVVVVRAVNDRRRMSYVKQREISMSGLAGGSTASIYD